MDRRTLAQRAVAEAIGTFALVFAGTGAVVINAETNGAVGHVGVALTFGLIVMAMIYATGHISGAHINPAVTIAFWAARHFPSQLVPVYLIAQIVGAVSASLLLRVMFGNLASLGATQPRDGAGQSFALEIVLTFVLMFVIMAVATDVRAVGQSAAIAIGGTVGLEALFAGPISGASMNPARSLAPAIVANHWDSQWTYVVGPIAGALIGAFVYAALREPVRSAPELIDEAGGTE
jgi:MIP family channel proteins